MVEKTSIGGIRNEMIRIHGIIGIDVTVRRRGSRTGSR